MSQKKLALESLLKACNIIDSARTADDLTKEEITKSFNIEEQKMESIIEYVKYLNQHALDSFIKQLEDETVELTRNMLIKNLLPHEHTFYQNLLREHYPRINFHMFGLLFLVLSIIFRNKGFDVEKLIFELWNDINYLENEPITLEVPDIQTSINDNDIDR